MFDCNADTPHQVELVEHETIPGQADGPAEIPLRDNARRRSSGRQNHQRREVVRRHRRVEEMTVGAEARRRHAESLVRQPHRAVWRRRLGGSFRDEPSKSVHSWPSDLPKTFL